MSNPFLDQFPNTPLTQQQIDEEQRLLAEVQRTRESDERHKLYESAVVAEIQRYDSMVMETLGQLKEAAYPSMGVHRHEPKEALRPSSDYFPSRRHSWESKLVPPITQWWQLGSSATYEIEVISGKNTRVDAELYFKPVVSVGLQMDGSTATNFVVTYYGKHFAHPSGRSLSRTDHSSLNREALVQALIELHKPSKRSEVVLSQSPIVGRVLRRISELPSLSAIRWSGYRLSLEDSYSLPLLADDPRLIPPTDDSGQKVSAGDINEYFDSDGHTSQHSLVSVSIVFNAQDNPTHYESRVEEMDQLVVAQLNEGALYAAIERALSILEAEKVKAAQPSTQKRNKGWFRR